MEWSQYPSVITTEDWKDEIFGLSVGEDYTMHKQIHNACVFEYDLEYSYRAVQRA